MPSHDRMVLALVAAVIGVVLLALTGCDDGAPEAPASPAAQATSRVVGVADGDTAFIEIDGRRETVRLVGIDAPESVGPYRESGCLGAEATARLRELLPFGSQVRVATDPAQDPRDRFDRLLGYVFREGEETSVNERMVAEGMAWVFVYREDPFSEQDAFRRAEKAAREGRLGVWGACGPDGRGPDEAASAGRACPAGRPVKGNLPSAIYHRPGDESYDATRPERCFADAREAEAAGFRPAER